MLCLVCDACHSKYIELLQGIPPTQQIFFDFQRTSSFTKKIVFIYHNKENKCIKDKVIAVMAF